MNFRLIILILFFPISAFAQLSVAKIFSDNMVIQRNKPIHVWGKANPGEIVTLFFSGLEKKTIVSEDTNWSITLPALAADVNPKTIKICTSTSTIELSNILIGDVWLCIGQSNMEWPMQREMHFTEELPHANQKHLRFFNPTYPGKNIYNTVYTDSVVQRLNTSRFYEGNWQTSDSNSIRNMSAVAYYFGKMINSVQHIPVGLINLSIGGAPLETFINPKALATDTRFAEKLSGDWLQNGKLPIWVRERGSQNIGSLSNVPTDQLGKFHPYKPGVAYSCGIEPLTTFSICGIINYQGESNAQEIERVNEYPELSKLMIDDYRRQWKDSTLPYYFVQLSSIDTLNYRGQLWPVFRNMQRTILDILPYSGMAVCTDAGAPHDVHPTNKKIVGERLARWITSSTSSGPLPIKASWKNKFVIIKFKHLANGLKTLDNNSVRGFSFDGIHEEVASISNNRKFIQIASKQKVEAVFYGWKPYSDANLCNSEDLPASTFSIPVK